MPKSPFFIIGSVRSGTTFLRDVLRQHPNLACPEETHFFRWSDPFGTPTATSHLLNNPTLKKHRQMDKISEEQFKRMLYTSFSRSDLQSKYMNLYLAQNQLQEKRWFDKTPQNAYGAAMIACQFPWAKFVHIVRNPIDVISSLRIGKVLKVDKLVAACNVWNEAAQQVYTLKRAYPQRVYEVRYEDFTGNFLPELEKMLAFVDEDFKADYFSKITVAAKQHDHDYLFSKKEQQIIKRLCNRWANHYGYFNHSGET